MPSTRAAALNGETPEIFLKAFLEHSFGAPRRC